jgi:uncharacterized protein (DUF2141 family)
MTIFDCTRTLASRGLRSVRGPLVVALAASLICSFAVPMVADAGETATLTIVVDGLRNGRGQVGCRLYRPSEDFARDDSPAIVGRQLVPIEDRRARCVFAGLAPGRYAVALMHDENGNRRLDTNLVGIPVEGFGFTNNAEPHTFGPPTFDEAAVVVRAGRTTAQRVRVMYP